MECELSAVDCKRIDVSLVATHRPDILSRTLQSFQEKILRNFDVQKVICNLDPAMGDDKDGKACLRLIYELFPNAFVRTPSAPNFSEAVKFTWSNMRDIPSLHLEDDWLALIDVYPYMIDNLFCDQTGSIYLSQSDRKIDEAVVQERKVVDRLFGMKYRSRMVSDFGTSPRLFAPGIAKSFGFLINPNKCPEKQVLRRRNKRLGRLQERYLCKALWGENGEKVIIDIGREWREQRSIKKVNSRNGDVRWVEASRD